MCFILINAWSHLRRTNRCTYQWGEHISTPDIGKQLHFMVFGFWLKRIPIHQLTQNLCFKHSFPPLNSWSRLRRTNRCTYQLGEHIRTSDIGIQRYISWFSVTFFWLKRIPIHQLTPNRFNIQFYFCIHHHVLDAPIGGCYSQKFSLQNLTAWHLLAWQKGAIHKLFSAQIVFFTNSQKFFPLTFSHYMVHINGGAYIQQFVH